MLRTLSFKRALMRSERFSRQINISERKLCKPRRDERRVSGVRTENLCEVFFSISFWLHRLTPPRTRRSFYRCDIKIITRSALTPPSHDSTTLIFMFAPCISCVGRSEIFAHSHSCKKRAKSVFVWLHNHTVEVGDVVSHHFPIQSSLGGKLSACNNAA